MFSGRMRELGYGVGVFVFGTGVYLALALLDASFWVTQGALAPAVVLLGLIDRVLPIDVAVQWLDIDVANTAARVGRALVFAATVLMVYVPTRLYVCRPSRSHLAVMSVAWLLVVLALAIFAFLGIALELSWAD